MCIPQHESIQLLILIASKHSVHVTCFEKPPDEVRLAYVGVGCGCVRHTEKQRSHQLSRHDPHRGCQRDAS